MGGKFSKSKADKGAKSDDSKKKQEEKPKEEKPKEDKPKEKPKEDKKDDKAKPDKPKEEKPDKPKEEKPDKPKEEKPDKPKDDKPDKPKDPEDKSDDEDKAAEGDEPVDDKEREEIEKKGGGKGKKRRGSVIDELNALERTKSYNKIEEVAGSLPEDVRVLTLKQKEELWDFYDKDKNGKMDMGEMKTVMRHLMRYRAKHATRQERKSIELRAMIMTPYQLEDFNEENLAKRVFDSLEVGHDGAVVKADFIQKFNLDHDACRVS